MQHGLPYTYQRTVDPFLNKELIYSENHVDYHDGACIY